jgi:hypothetical protein
MLTITVKDVGTADLPFTLVDSIKFIIRIRGGVTSASYDGEDLIVRGENTRVLNKYSKSDVIMKQVFDELAAEDRGELVRNY